MVHYRFNLLERFHGVTLKGIHSHGLHWLLIFARTLPLTSAVPLSVILTSLRTFCVFNNLTDCTTGSYQSTQPPFGACSGFTDVR